jgi:hypothetical protein
MTTMDLATIDRELARFRSAADAVSANLLELDADPNRQLLDTAPLTGATGAAWAEARTALTSVWDWFARFTTFLDAATELRDSPRTRLATGRERQLAAFLTDASIEVSRDDIPLRDRDLLEPRQATNWCTADELLAVMTDAFARARDIVTQVAARWDDLVPRVTGARARLVGLPKRAELRGLHDRLDTLSDALVADPLSVQSDDVAAVEADLDSIARSEHEHDELRRAVLSRIRDARIRLEAFERQATDARCEWDTVRAKIARPELVPPPAVEASVANALNAIADRADTGQLADASRALDGLAADLDALGTRLDASVAAGRDALATRDHLRGRLDAYRAKAHGIGLDEDAEVTETYERALAALHVAPSDLTEAAALVTAYQRLLTPLPEPEAR